MTQCQRGDARRNAQCNVNSGSEGRMDKMRVYVQVEKEWRINFHRAVGCKSDAKEKEKGLVMETNIVDGGSVEWQPTPFPVQDRRLGRPSQNMGKRQWAGPNWAGWSLKSGRGRYGSGMID